MNKPRPTAKSRQLINCLQCGVLAEAPATRCAHCHSYLHSRKPDANQRTWIYLLTSILLFFPANLLPITYTSYLAQPALGDTILSNILLLWHHQSYFVAGIIFLASILIPIVKIVILVYLLTHQYPSSPPVFQTKLYRFVHFIGRWSMIDVFVVALLGALVHGKLAIITPGIGIFAFAGVVIASMVAAEAFDIRLLWDNYRFYNGTTTNKAQK